MSSKKPVEDYWEKVAKELADSEGLDRVPGTRIYIGGLFTFTKKKAFTSANITHVVSAIRMNLQDDARIKNFKHLQVEIDDVEDENLLQYFPQTNSFIESGLNEGGAVFVHCAMGKSRSATVCIAYLMWKFRISPTVAIESIQKSRPLVDPNDGFKQQLFLYQQMDMTDAVEDHPVYQRWMYQRAVQLSSDCGQAPEPDQIRFEDEHVSSDEKAHSEYKCRKCRRKLATSNFLIPHEQLPHNQPFPPTLTCAHIFIDPLSWMKPELEKGLLEGRLECPKCSTNIGKYAWQGMKCSCGAWVVPAITLSKSRIDESKILRKDESLGIRRGAGVGIPVTKAGGRGLL